MKQDEFFDEQIIDMMNKAEGTGENVASQVPDESEGKKQPEENDQIKPEDRTIDTGIKIQGKWIYFERRSLANEKITMMVPKDFAPMSLEVAKVKYPSEQRPETILMDETGAINIMFNYMEGNVDNSNIESFRNQIFGMMKRVNQGIKQQEIGAVNVAGKQIAYVEFSNPVMDGKLYNLMFYIEMEGQPLMGSFNCRTKEMKYWKPIAFEMMKSIEIVEREE